MNELPQNHLPDSYLVLLAHIQTAWHHDIRETSSSAEFIETLRIKTISDLTSIQGEAHPRPLQCRMASVNEQPTQTGAAQTASLVSHTSDFAASEAHHAAAPAASSGPSFTGGRYAWDPSSCLSSSAAPSCSCRAPLGGSTTPATPANRVCRHPYFVYLDT